MALAACRAAARCLRTHCHTTPHVRQFSNSLMDMDISPQVCWGARCLRKLDATHVTSRWLPVCADGCLPDCGGRLGRLRIQGQRHLHARQCLVLPKLHIAVGCAAGEQATAWPAVLRLCGKACTRACPLACPQIADVTHESLSPVLMFAPRVREWTGWKPVPECIAAALSTSHNPAQACCSSALGRRCRM